jgi:hypothetical protein
MPFKERTAVTVFPSERDAFRNLRNYLRDKLERRNLTYGQAIVEAERIIRETLNGDNKERAA